MKADTIWIIITVVLLVAHIGLLVWRKGFDRSFDPLVVLNLIIAVSVCGYWVRRSILIDNVFMDWVDYVWIGFEVVTLVAGLVYFLQKPTMQLLNGIIFTVHFIGTLLSLALFLLVDINRLT